MVLVYCGWVLGDVVGGLGAVVGLLLFVVGFIILTRLVAVVGFRCEFVILRV